MSGIKSSLVLAIVAIAALTVVQNQAPTVVVFFGLASPSLPLGLWAIIAAATGALVMWVLSLMLAIGGSRRRPPNNRDRRPERPDRDPEPPRRTRPDERRAEPEEIWDEDEEWDDRARRESQYAPHLNEPREPWEALEDDEFVEPNSSAGGDRRDRTPGDPGDRPEPPLELPLEPPSLDLPPPSRYEQPQQPIEAERQGSVYSFSYANKPEDIRPEPEPPIDLGRDGGRVPIDLPQRSDPRALDLPLAPDGLDELEEIAPIVEPNDDIVPPPARKKPRRESPVRVPRGPKRDAPREPESRESRSREPQPREPRSREREPNDTGDWEDAARDRRDWV
ncbi:MAG: hypothetical protein ACFB9N_17460 [Geitlerinemataceae cyanobacterium]